MTTTSQKIQPAYTTKRNDISSLVPDTVKTVLDVGCSTGSLSKNLKSQRDIEVTGIEYNSEAGEIARQHLDKVFIGNLETLNLEEILTPNYFDCIIFGDILEHLQDPWNILKSLLKFLKDDGVIITSLPNVRHYTTIFDLVVRGRWPYRSRGIHDRTHLRFFTRKNIQDLFNYAGLSIKEIRPIYRIREAHHPMNSYSKYVSLLPVGKDFFTFQYIVLGSKGKHE